MALIVLLLLGGPAHGDASGPATPGFTGADLRQPATTEERRRVVEEHYRLYGDAVDPGDERLRVEALTYREHLPESFHELDTADLASIDPRGTVALSISHRLDRGIHRTALRPELRSIPPQELADWQRRSAAESTDLESGILQPIADSISEIWGLSTLPEAVGLMDVQVDLDGVRLSYSAAATWFRDP
ncbi:MAG: hypothetical protein MI919_16310, partial [Holophagales bacterium]|nr:hypothetical protein [Holophagales bacterium]